jgi:glycosyltransferase involved in cell wall biosynthesis
VPAEPRVAVVIPCFNDRAFLPEAIASAQADEPIELVVVDDGSTDPATIALLEQLSSEDVRVIHQHNSGPSAARMRGVRASRAPYVLPLDSDDLLGRGSIRALANALDAQPEVDVAWGNLELFTEDGRRVFGRGPRTLDPWLVTYVNEYPLAAMFRRATLLEAGGYQLREGYEDWDLWMALAERGARGTWVDRLVERHRVHGSRRWSQDFRRHQQSLMILRARHRSLFAARPQTRRRSLAPWRLKLLLPLIEAAPLSPANVYRLEHLACHPLRLPGMVLRRRWQAFAGQFGETANPAIDARFTRKAG